MRSAFSILFVAATAFAQAPEELGSFRGTLFTGASLRQPLTLQGGDFSACEVDSTTSTAIHKCAVSGGNISVEGEQYKLERVVVMRSTYGTHHYYRGSRNIQVGD